MENCSTSGNHLPIDDKLKKEQGLVQEQEQGSSIVQYLKSVFKSKAACVVHPVCLRPSRRCTNGGYTAIK